MKQQTLLGIIHFLNRQKGVQIKFFFHFLVFFFIHRVKIIIYTYVCTKYKLKS